MNAYELADDVLNINCLVTRQTVASALRQQADRIAELEKENKELSATVDWFAEKQTNAEPVAWINEDNFLLGDVLNSAMYRTKPNEEFTIPLYTTPQTKDFKYDPETGEPLIDGYPLYSGLPQTKHEVNGKAVPLSDEEIWELCNEHIYEVTCGHSMKTCGFIEFARAIELKIRGE